MSHLVIGVVAIRVHGGAGGGRRRCGGGRRHGRAEDRWCRQQVVGGLFQRRREEQRLDALVASKAHVHQRLSRKRQKNSQ